MKFLQVIALLLAHHPICENFAPDMVGNKHPICRGCAFFFPPLYTTLLLGFLIPPLKIVFQNYFWAVNIIGAGLLATFFLKLLIRELPQWIDDIIHACTGFGAGLVIVANLVVDWPLWIKILVVLDVNLALAFASYFHLTKMEKICGQCPYQSMGKTCPGYTHISVVPFEELDLSPEELNEIDTNEGLTQLKPSNDG